MTTAPVARPAHIPAEAEFDIDLFRDPGFFDDPHTRVLELAQTGPPVFWTPRNGGNWVVLGYEHAQTVFRTPELFSSVLVPHEQRELMLKMMPVDAPRLPRLTPLLMDPPEHTAFRQPLQSVFSPKFIAALHDQIAALAHQLIDAVAEQGECEFVAAIAEQFPVRIFLKLMGLPEHRLAEFRALAHDAFVPRDRNDESTLLANLRNIANAMRDVILAKRDHPGDDLISTLWSLEVDGAPMTYELMEDYCALLFLGGLDTVVIALSFGIHHLARHPELQNTLRENPQLIGDATEELLRRYTFTVPVRRIAKDTQLGGWDLKENERIMLYLPAIDLDANTFANPANVDLARKNKMSHMLFGGGAHRCIGMHLARLELQTFYRAILERLPNFRLDPDQPAQYLVTQNLALRTLPLRWD